MQTQMVELTTMETMQNVLRGISALSTPSIKKLAEYVEGLIEEQEEAEDIAYIEAHKNDGPNVPLCEIINDYEAEYGPLG